MIQQQQQQSHQTLPKPPLAKKTMAIHDDTHSMSTQAQENLLKMADEGISQIKQELQRKRQNLSLMPPIEEKPQQQSNVKSNFNLSFNNSFNTSIAGAGKPQIAVQAESSLINGEVIKHQFVADLEERLTTRLKQGENQTQKLAAVTQTFDEVILRNEHFSGLLQKIKNAYMDYVTQLQGNSLNSEQLHLTDL